MADTFSKEKRSQIMAAVLGKNNRSTERRLRAGLVSAGISGWRINAADFAGKPDFVFDEQKIAFLSTVVFGMVVNVNGLRKLI
jgi:G:T-mismatch repair DNA endonuclease (very short patch repair protein)